MRLSKALSSAARSLPILAIAVVLVVPVPALAQEEGARELFMQGSDAYRVGDYEAAVTAWRNAYELDPQPLLLYNLGQAYERLGRLPEAIEALSGYLEAAPTGDPLRSDATARLASMRERLGRTSIVVTSNVEGAVIRIDGEERARTPRLDPIQVDPGTHRVTVEMEGHEPFHASVTVVAGMRAEVQAELESLGGGEVAAAEGRIVRPVEGYILIGAGGGAAIVGGLLGWFGSRRADDAVYSDDSDAKAGRAMAGVGDVLLFGGAAAAVGGVLWLFLGAEKVQSEPAVAGDWRVRPLVDPTLMGANAEVRF